MFARLSVLMLLATPCAAQFGRRNAQRREAQAGAQFGGAADVDAAMAGWEQLSKNPEKMQEVFESMKDPEVMAKAQEMLKDPQYMAAARKKLADLEAKAKARGMLNEAGAPVPGAASMAAMGEMASQPGANEAREFELENAARYQAGELNSAELGMANLKQAMGDPQMIASVMNMMKDPNTMAEVQKMMADPAFKAQAEQMVSSMKQSGGLDIGDLARQSQHFAEVDRLRRENAMLKNAMHNEL